MPARRRFRRTCKTLSSPASSLRMVPAPRAISPALKISARGADIFNAGDIARGAGTIRSELAGEDNVLHVRRNRRRAGIVACYGTIRYCSWGFWLSEPERNTRIRRDEEGLIGVHQVGSRIGGVDPDVCPPIACHSIRPITATLAHAGPIKVQCQQSNTVGREQPCFAGPCPGAVHHHATIQRGVGETYNGRSLLLQHHAS